MDKKIILSICVPTYNRPAELRRCLESIMPQMNERVELVIGDDGDPSVTKEILKDFPHQNIVYFSNPDGPGYGRNVIAITQHASGEYVWWCGDDDIVAAGAIKRVLNILTKHKELDFMWVDYAAYPRLEQFGLDLGESRFFKDSNEVLEKVANQLGYISVIVMRRILALPTASLKSPFIKSNFFQLYIVMDVLAHAKASYYMREPAIINYPSTTGSWYDPFQLYGADYYEIVQGFKGKFKRRSLRIMIAKNFAHFWRAVVVGRARGVWGLAPVGAERKLFKYYWNYPGYWIALPFLLMPQRYTKFCYELFKKLREFFRKLH